MKTIRQILVFLFSMFLFDGSLDAREDIEFILHARKQIALSQIEKELVGKWAGENEDLRWEILRSVDGTYEVVVVDDKTDSTEAEIEKGIWGVDEEGFYFYIRLYCRGEISISHIPTMREKIIRVEEDLFITGLPLGLGDDEYLENRERRIAEFRYGAWNQSKSEPVAGGDATR